MDRLVTLRNRYRNDNSNENGQAVVEQALSIMNRLK